jgi:hypothetical protein
VPEITGFPKPRENAFMEKIRIVSQTRVHGEVEYNDGEFAEVQTVGIEGIEKNLLLETIQVHREDTCEQVPGKAPCRIVVEYLHNDRGNDVGIELEDLYCRRILRSR